MTYVLKYHNSEPIIVTTTKNELVKNVDTIDSNKQNLEEKIEDIDQKIPDTSKFVVTQDFNRLTKINSNA